MTSYRDGKATGLTLTRLIGTQVFGGRVAAAQFSKRSKNTVIRYCQPIACDVGTRADLYDLDHVVRQFRTMGRYLCSITDGEGDRCGSSVMHNAPFPVCAFHAAAISEFFGKQDRFELMRQAALARTEEMKAEFANRPLKAPRSCVVYYVQLDAVIKIGTTIDLTERMKNYPPYARLLATEPGSYDIEQKRLREFKEYLRAGNEWFSPGPRLRAHIEKLMESSAVA